VRVGQRLLAICLIFFNGSSSGWACWDDFLFCKFDLEVVRNGWRWKYVPSSVLKSPS